MEATLTLVREAAAKQVVFSDHARRRMRAVIPFLQDAEIHQVIRHGEIIEDYPNDRRGHSCLMTGQGKAARPIHVVCAPQAERLVIITAYLPDATEWDAEFRRRKL
jgi:hypothetical protein